MRVKVLGISEGSLYLAYMLAMVGAEVTLVTRRRCGRWCFHVRDLLPMWASGHGDEPLLFAEEYVRDVLYVDIRDFDYSPHDVTVSTVEVRGDTLDGYLAAVRRGEDPLSGDPGLDMSLAAVRGCGPAEYLSQDVARVLGPPCRWGGKRPVEYLEPPEADHVLGGARVDALSGARFTLRRSVALMWEAVKAFADIMDMRVGPIRTVRLEYGAGPYTSAAVLGDPTRGRGSARVGARGATVRAVGVGSRIVGVEYVGEDLDRVLAVHRLLELGGQLPLLGDLTLRAPFRSPMALASSAVALRGMLRFPAPRGNGTIY